MWNISPQTIFLLLILLSSTVSSIQAQQEQETPKETAADLALLYSAVDGDIEGVQKALDEGANVNIRQPNTGQSPLMIASLRGHADLVQYLLTRSDTDPSVPEKDGYTPAHGAGFQGRAQVMKALHEAGIDVVDDFAQDGYAPFHRACWGRREHHTETIQYLYEHAGVDIHNFAAKNGKTCRDMTRNPDTIAYLEKTFLEKDEL